MRIYGFYIPDDLMTELKTISEETGAPISVFVRRAIKEYLEKRKQKHEKTQN
jgi:metal-responsive CopG/Arc/MetJ family transcriptional regulator